MTKIVLLVKGSPVAIASSCLKLLDRHSEHSYLTNCLCRQDDYRVCMDYNIIQKDSVPICPVDSSGCFTAEVADFVGQYVKVGDNVIV